MHAADLGVGAAPCLVQPLPPWLLQPLLPGLLQPLLLQPLLLQAVLGHEGELVEVVVDRGLLQLALLRGRGGVGVRVRVGVKGWDWG